MQPEYINPEIITNAMPVTHIDVPQRDGIVVDLPIALVDTRRDMNVTLLLMQQIPVAEVKWRWLVVREEDHWLVLLLIVPVVVPSEMEEPPPFVVRFDLDSPERAQDFFVLAMSKTMRLGSLFGPTLCLEFPCETDEMVLQVIVSTPGEAATHLILHDADTGREFNVEKTRCHLRDSRQAKTA
jgi:hypothetical protein